MHFASPWLCLVLELLGCTEPQALFSAGDLLTCAQGLVFPCGKAVLLGACALRSAILSITGETETTEKSATNLWVWVVLKSYSLAWL